MSPITKSPGVQLLKTEYAAAKAIIQGDGKALGGIIGHETANTVTVLATDGAGEAVGKGISTLRGTTASGLGDLTTGEVRTIQGAVNQDERPLEVGGRRRWHKTWSRN